VAMHDQLGLAPIRWGKRLVDTRGAGSAVDETFVEGGVPPAAERWRSAGLLALRDTVPVAMGYVPLGAAYGVLLVNSGLAWYWATVSSILIFAGAAQFLSVTLLATRVPLVEVASVTFLVNLRHVFYGLSFPLRRIDGFLRRCYGAFALTDETYSLIAAKADEGLSGRRIHLIQVFSQAWWVLGSTVGAVASTALPGQIKGIDFALTALFVVLAMEHLAKRESRKSMGYGLVAALLAAVVAGGQFLTVALGLYLVAVLASWRRGARRRGPREVTS
jgi:branched chain amino acid efflux pump